MSVGGHGDVSTPGLHRRLLSGVGVRQQPIELQRGGPGIFAEFTAEAADLLQSCPGAQRSGIRPVSSDRFHRHGPDRQCGDAVDQPAAGVAPRHDQPVHECGEPRRTILEPDHERRPGPRSPGHGCLESELDDGSCQFLEPDPSVAKPLSVRHRNNAAHRHDAGPHSGRGGEAVPVRIPHAGPGGLGVARGKRHLQAGRMQDNSSRSPRSRVVHADPTFTQDRTASCASTTSMRSCFIRTSIPI